MDVLKKLNEIIYPFVISADSINFDDLESGCLCSSEKLFNFSSKANKHVSSRFKRDTSGNMSLITLLSSK